MVRKTKVKIVKGGEIDLGYRLTCSEDGTVLRKEPIDIQNAVSLVKQFSLTQQSKVKNEDGTTTYVYA